MDGVKLTKGTETLYLDGTPVAGSLSYLETDHLGTARIAANPTTNAQQWKWDFFANTFGDNPATVAPSVGIDVPLRYPGQLFDAETGLHYNYFRDYEPGTGRYVESDPIGLDGGMSTYGYVFASPLSSIDPKGLSVDDYLNCVSLKIKTGGYMNCSDVLFRTAVASGQREVNRVCDVTVEGLTCVTTCGLKAFVGGDAFEVLFNVNKAVAIRALEKGAKEVAFKTLSGGLPLLVN